MEKSYKKLGKIESIDYGVIEDYPFEMGLIITFSYPAGGCFTTETFRIDIITSISDIENDKPAALQQCGEIQHSIKRLLKDAKVSVISDLKNKPVELTFKDRVLQSYRILTEVL